MLFDSCIQPWCKLPLSSCWFNNVCSCSFCRGAVSGESCCLIPPRTTVQLKLYSGLCSRTLHAWNILSLHVCLRFAGISSYNSPEFVHSHDVKGVSNTPSAAYCPPAKPSPVKPLLILIPSVCLIRLKCGFTACSKWHCVSIFDDLGVT